MTRTTHTQRPRPGQLTPPPSSLSPAQQRLLRRIVCMRAGYASGREAFTAADLWQHAPGDRPDRTGGERRALAALVARGLVVREGATAYRVAAHATGELWALVREAAGQYVQVDRPAIGENDAE